MSTSKYNATALVVDDRDSSITYSSGWLKVTSAAEYKQTRTGADTTGMTAIFSFRGTGVEVYGSLGSIDVYGRPVSSYELDGLPDTQAQYQAPIIEPSFFTDHTLFYRSPSLSDQEHTLVITNVNGTKPSVLWIDYIVYTPSTTPGPSSALTSGTSASQSPSLTGNSPPASSSPSFSSSSSNHAGAIAGGVIGGVVFLAAVAFLLCWFVYRRRQQGARSYLRGDVNPFGSWPANGGRYPANMNAEKVESTPEITNRTTPVESTNLIPSLPGYNQNGAEGVASQSTIRLHSDSGIRLPPGAVVDIPPVYTDV